MAEHSDVPAGTNLRPTAKPRCRFIFFGMFPKYKVKRMFFLNLEYRTRFRCTRLHIFQFTPERRPYLANFSTWRDLHHNWQTDKLYPFQPDYQSCFAFDQMSLIRCTRCSSSGCRQPRFFSIFISSLE